MDGIESRRGVFLMAATNRPDIIDPAVLRPGRLDKILHVGFPTAEDRVDILRALTKVWLENSLCLFIWSLIVVFFFTEWYEAKSSR